MLFEDITKTIKTPLVRINRMAEGSGATARRSNASTLQRKGSIGVAMIDAERRASQQGTRSSSSPRAATGSRSPLSVRQSYRPSSPCPTPSMERFLDILGAELVTSPEQRHEAAMAKAEKLSHEMPNSFMPRQQ